MTAYTPYRKGDWVRRMLHQAHGDCGVVKFSTDTEYGQVMEDSPETNRGVAVWWRLYVGPKEMVDKLTLIENLPDSA